MFRTCLWAISLLLLQSCSPKLSSLDSGVKLVEKKIVEGYQTPDAILFSFSGDTHLVNYFFDLEEKIKTQFGNSNLKIEFSYNLTSSEPLAEDLKKLAQKSNVFDDYKIIANVNLDFEDSSNNFNKSKKAQIYTVNVKIIDSHINAELINSKLLVNSTYNILSESSKTAVLIHDLITQN